MQHIKNLAFRLQTPQAKVKLNRNEHFQPNVYGGASQSKLALFSHEKNTNTNPLSGNTSSLTKTAKQVDLE